MSKALLPMEIDDCAESTRIRSISYEGPTNLIVHHRSVSVESMAKVVEERKKEFHAPGTYHWKVVDVGTGKMMTAAKFELHNTGKGKTPESDDEALKSKEAPFVPPEVNLPALVALLGPLGQAHQEIMGDRPHLMLATLSTLPEYRRQGAAAMVVKWGVETADEMGIECYLTSTTMARHLYEEFGFALMKEIWFDRVPWGGEGKDWHGVSFVFPSML